MGKYAAIIVGFLLCFQTGSAQTYDITTPVTGLANPVAFEIHDDYRIFLTLKGGFNTSASEAKVLVYDTAGTLLNTFWDFTDSCDANFEKGVLGIELDPDFDNNHYVYVYYNHRVPAGLRVVRFTENNNAGTNPLIILDIQYGNIPGNHVGGNIRVRPSEGDKLYVTIGDLADTSNSQDLTNPYGKFLRINTDGTIPTDNPYYDDGDVNTGNDDRIWSLGHRNAFDFNFSPVNDSLYSSENGAGTEDEVNQVWKGANYGWPGCEGTVDYGGSCGNSAYTVPLDVYQGPLPAVTGIIHYSGNVMPEFENHLLVADNDDGNITDFTLGNAPYFDTVLSRQVAFNLIRLTSLQQGPEGCIYAMKGGFTTSGLITRICPTGMGTPELSSELYFRLSPNPVMENAALYFSPNFIGGRYEVVDVLGRTIVSELITGGRMTFQKGNIPAGAYFISATHQGASITNPVIME